MFAIAPELSNKSRDQLKRRMKELIDKMTMGTLSPKETERASREVAEIARYLEKNPDPNEADLDMSVLSGVEEGAKTHRRRPTDPDPRLEEPDFITPKRAKTPQQETETFAVPAPALAPILMRWTEEVNDILERACRPVITLLGAVSVKLRMESVE